MFVVKQHQSMMMGVRQLLVIMIWITEAHQDLIILLIVPHVHLIIKGHQEYQVSYFGGQSPITGIFTQKSVCSHLFFLALYAGVLSSGFLRKNLLYIFHSHCLFKNSLALWCKNKITHAYLFIV